MSPAPQLFPAPPAELVAGLERLARVLDEVAPLQAKHRATLPGGIRRLSGMLTVDRDELPRDYMNRAPLLSAYLHYFLPWNVYRQGRLLAGLDLRLRPGSRVLDLGAGPLTFALALWLARPGMREQELHYLGVDRSDQALKHGRQLMRALAGDQGWDVRTDKRPAGGGRGPRADFMVAANLLNELDWESGPRRGADPEATPHDLLFDRWEGMLADDAAILLIEPGMRAAGRNLVRLREAALARGWRILAPCPHREECPMPGQRNKPWCHFNFVPTGAPDWLVRLSRAAKLPKERASLSFLLLVRGEEPPVKVASGMGADRVRVISGSFDLPDRRRGTYGCAARGLVLLEDRKGPDEAPPPGTLLQATWPDKPRRDHKSGAWILPRSR